jgi:UDP-glucose 4-epimerase
VMGERRAGAAVQLVCGSEKAGRDLGWEPRRSDLGTMIDDAWQLYRTVDWDRTQPGGPALAAE